MLKTFPKGGVHPSENKLSAGQSIRDLAPPKTVFIPLSQHLGAPAQAVVNPGDKVKTGQLIAKAPGFVSTCMHASLSGTVTKIDNVLDASGYKKPCIIIESDEQDEWLVDIDRSSDLVKKIELNEAQIRSRIQDAGIVGMGGAGFPTHVKMTSPEGKTAHTLIINGVECEPYLTADHALMLEKAEEILVGALIMQKAIGAQRVLVGIENNKPDAIALLTRLATPYGTGIDIYPLEVKYPQGGEKQLIKALVNREVPSGGLPIDVGCVVHNVGTAFAVYEAVQKNKPLFERVVTVSGSAVQNPANLRARVGTPMVALIEAAGGMPEDTAKIISGGPMMGKALSADSAPVVKTTSGILLMPEAEAARPAAWQCIRCARCVQGCPMSLEPYLLKNLAAISQWDTLEPERVLDCIECGACSYTCPSNIPLLDYIRLGKANVTQIVKSRTQKK